MSKTVEEAWAFYMTTIPPDDRYDTPTGDFVSGYNQGLAAGAAHGAAEERGAVLEMIIMRKEAQHGCPKRTHYPASRCIICEVYDDLEARIRQRGENRDGERKDG